MSAELFALLLFISTFGFLLLGYPVAFTLGGGALLFAALGYWAGEFDLFFLQALPDRIWGLVLNETLIAIPLFIWMGVILERSQIASELLSELEFRLRRVRGGLALSVTLVGGILAASTGIVGATVVTLGLLALPTLIRSGTSPALASGLIAATGTLGQLIPPSIVLIVLGDAISSAHQQAQLSLGNFAPDAVTVGDLFLGALVPGGFLMVAYALYALWVERKRPQKPEEEATHDTPRSFFKSIGAPMLLILLVLGSILLGVATPTEASALGALGAASLTAWQRRLPRAVFLETLDHTVRITAMIFSILIGASLFSLVFRGFNGDEWIAQHLSVFSGSPNMALLLVMLAFFLMGFFLDFFEIVFVMVPIVGPPLLRMGFDPVWLGILFALNLQTSFLTPPFGFSLFYLRGVLPESISTATLYRGVIPFILIQILAIAVFWIWPEALIR